MTPTQAVWRGHRNISLPGLGGLAVGAFLGWWLTGKVAGALLGIIVGIPPAWFWWSYAIPRWRDWLEDEGISEASVYRMAVGSGLVFPRRHYLEGTEFRRRDGTRGWRTGGPSE